MLAIGAAFFGAMLATCGYLFFEDEPPATDGRSSAAVVVAVRDLARLESASYHMERVIDLRSRETRFMGLVEAEDAVLLVAAADVTAGVDLTEMRDGDVEVDLETGEAVVVLSPPRVLSTSLDNERTFVHTRRTDLLAKRDEGLESRARRKAERTLRDAALEAGILERAQRNAAATVEALVSSLGYDRVEVRFRDE
jgi:hypothetical protein